MPRKCPSLAQLHFSLHQMAIAFNLTDPAISGLTALLKTSSEYIEVILRNRRTMFPGLMTHIDYMRLS